MDKADAAGKATAMQGQGVDLSVFTTMMKDGSLIPAVVYGNGAALQDAERPLFEAYFAHQRGDDVFAEMARKSSQILGKQ
ncbi:hypothetical protein [Amycolatopsis sp. cmx-8-4]|uniref:hypothetical protein n=1 Tax=Amycolatopsis sp. cmx-8-4 TaxID=2790947 RepID=UPI00397D19D4